jgi:hypothetical protein
VIDDHDVELVVVPLTSLRRADIGKVQPPTAGNGNVHSSVVVEAVEVMATGGWAADDQAVSTSGERGDVRLLFEGVGRAPNSQYSRCRLVEHPAPTQPSDGHPTDSIFGGLASCQRTVARGRELTHGAE